MTEEIIPGGESTREQVEQAHISIDEDNPLSEKSLTALFASISVEDLFVFPTKDTKRLNISSGEDAGHDYSND